MSKSAFHRSATDELLMAKFNARLGECNLIDCNELSLDNRELFFLEKRQKLLRVSRY